jgi:predicted ATPase
VATRTSPITVGRDAELARIDVAREQAGTGRPVIVLVRGEAGIGKSRLVADAMDRARAAGSPILHGACLDLTGEGLPYLPFVEALRKFVRTTPPDRAIELLGPARAELGPLIPEVAALAQHVEPGGHDAAEPLPDRPDSTVDRARLFERILGFLGRLGAEAPAVAVIEDVQWVDPATHDLITFLVRNVTSERLVAILTCRTDDLTPGHPVLAWLAELGRAPGAVRIELGRLSREDVERQLVAMNGAPVPREIARSIWHRSGGHPLFAEELLASATEAGTPAPPSLVDVLLSRVATLSSAPWRWPGGRSTSASSVLSSVARRARSATRSVPRPPAVCCRPCPMAVTASATSCSARSSSASCRSGSGASSTRASPAS